MAKTERESNRRSGRLVGAAVTTKELVELRRLQREKLEHTKPAEKERVASVPQREQLEKTPEPPLPKTKWNKAVCPEYQIMKEEKVKVS